MGEWPDTEAGDWILTGAAAKVAGVDRRTIVRWAKKGDIDSRVTPRGIRQVSRQSLIAAFERETVGRRTDQVVPDRKRAAPEVTIPYLVTASGTWGEWKPRHLPSAERVERLLAATRSLQEALADVEYALVEDLKDRDEQADIG